MDRIRSDEIYFSPIECKKGVMKCFLGYKEMEPIMFYVNNITEDFAKIRVWLESMLIEQDFARKSYTLKLGGSSPAVPKLEIKYVLDRGSNRFYYPLLEGSVVGKIKYIKIKYSFLGEVKEFKINTAFRTGIELAELFYRPIVEFLTSENFIDYNKLLKVKYYDKSLEYQSIMDSFKSQEIEKYMRNYYDMLRSRREKVKYKIKKI